MIIDVHAHYFPSDYMQFVGQRGIKGILATRREPPLHAPSLPAGPLFTVQAENLDSRFAMMNAAGVSRQILSMTMGPYLADEKDGVTAARMINDAYATLCKQNPDKFSYWASLPLPHVDASVAEIKRAMDEQGAIGVTLQCFCMNETVIRDEFDPIFAELDRRKATIFFHPCQNGICSHLVNDWGLTVCAGASMEDAVVAMHLIMKQIPRRFPNIKFIVPHFGGILPMLLQRLDGQMPQNDFAERPSATARRFYYDTVGWGSKAALLCAYTAFGETQLVPGSDWPILLPWESYTQTFAHIAEAGLPAAAVERILHKNVQGLLNIEK